MLMFLLIVLTIWSLILLHIFLRLRRLLNLNRWGRVGLGFVIFLLGLSYVPARMILAGTPEAGIGELLTLCTSIFIGYFTILWACLLVLEMTVLLIWGVWRLGLRNLSVERRHFVGVGLCLLAAGLTGIGIVTAQLTPGVSELGFVIPGATPLRALVISDSHLGRVSSTGQWKRTLERARSLEPDVLLIPGDLLDDSSSVAQRKARLLREFFPSEEVYISAGNHDLYSGLSAFEELCEAMDLQLLRQEVIVHKSGLLLAGIDDSQILDAGTAIGRLPRKEGPMILLSHRPAAAGLLRHRPATLIFSGHTHGGQIPPLQFLVPLANGMFRSGLYQVGEAQLYVSRGTGVWGPPLRLFASPELVVLNVKDEDTIRVVQGPVDNAEREGLAEFHSLARKTGSK